VLNLAVLVATPIQGGHHIVDLIAGFAVAAFAIVCSDRIAAFSKSERSHSRVETGAVGVPELLEPTATSPSLERAS